MNKIRNLIIISLSIFLFIILISCSASKSNGYRSIKIELLKGDSYVIRNDKEYETYKNMNLRNEDKIFTKDDSYLIFKLDDDKYIYIGSNSNVELYTNKKNKNKTLIRVNEGSIVTEVKNKLSDFEEFGVETPNSTMAIRGTTFGISVTKSNNKYDINYKLIEGSIDINVLEYFNNRLNVNNFMLNPMEEVNIEALGDYIIDNNLNQAIEDLNNNNCDINHYENLDDYISKTNNVNISHKKLNDLDIEEILRIIKDFHDDNEIRTVSIDSKFDVLINNETYKDFNIFEAKESYKIMIKPNNIEGYYVKNVLINGNIVDYKNEITINESSFIEVVYEEIDVITNINSNSSANILVNGEVLNNSLELKTLDEITLEFNDNDYLFLGYYIDNELVSSDKLFKYTPIDSKTIDIKSVLYDEDLDDKLDMYLNKEKLNANTSNFSIDTEETFDFNQFEFKYNDISIDNNMIEYHIYDESDLNTPLLDVNSIGNYVIIYNIINTEIEESINLIVSEPVEYGLTIYASPYATINYSYDGNDYTCIQNDYLKNFDCTKVDLSLDIDDNSTFIGWYKLDDNNIDTKLISNEEEFTLKVKENMTIYPLIVSGSDNSLRMVDDNFSTISSLDVPYDEEVDLDQYDVIYYFAYYDRNYYIKLDSDITYDIYLYQDGDYVLYNGTINDDDIMYDTCYVKFKTDNNIESEYISINRQV